MLDGAQLIAPARVISPRVVRILQTSDSLVGALSTWDLPEITKPWHNNLAMPDISSFNDLIRFLVSTGHLSLALCVILILALSLLLWGLGRLLPIRLNFGLSLGDRQEQQHDKTN